MKRILYKFIHSLGFLTEDDVAELMKQTREEVRNDLSHWNGEAWDLSNTVEQYAAVFKDVFEANHRLKKLEEYIGVHYVAENTKLFIGYKKNK